MNKVLRALALVIPGILSGCNGSSGIVTGGGGTASADNTPIQFLPARDYEAATVTSGLGAGALALDDFNDDGFTDLAVADCFGLGPAVLLNRGDGSFSAPTHPRTLLLGLDACTVAAGDFNEDGHNDIVTVSQATTMVSVLLGAGDGSFALGEQFPAGQGLLPQHIAVADFNRDGHSDLGVVITRPGQVAIFLGQGNGSFDAAGALSLGGIILMAAPADFNGDRIPDLAVAQGSADTVSVALGVGDGSFREPATFETGRDPEYVATGDLDGDGFTDMVSANSFSFGDAELGELSLLSGNGDGTFQPAIPLNAFPESSLRVTNFTAAGTAGVAIADFNQDGRPDLAVPVAESGLVVILRNIGEGQFVSDGDYAISAFPEPVLAADFNNDRRPDLVTSSNLPALAYQTAATRISILMNATGGPVDMLPP